MGTANSQAGRLRTPGTSKDQGLKTNLGPNPNSGCSSPSPRPRSLVSPPGADPGHTHLPERGRRASLTSAAPNANRRRLGHSLLKKIEKKPRKNNGLKEANRLCFCIPFDPSGLPVPYSHNTFAPRFRRHRPINSSLPPRAPRGNPVLRDRMERSDWAVHPSAKGLTSSFQGGGQNREIT